MGNMSKPPEPTKLTGSLVEAAVKEFELVLGRKNRGDDGAMRKGANVRKRNALGRGLSALMSSNELEVDALESAESVSDQTPGREIRGLASTMVSSIAPVVEESADLSAPQRAPATSVAGGLVYVPVSQLVRNPNQPRQHFSKEELDELSRSIRQTGLLQPILVRPRGIQTAAGEQTYEIIAGERRYRAAEQAGLHAIPALVRELDEREVLEVSIVENVQRSQLNAIEEARAYQRLGDEFGLSQEEIAKTVGKDRTTIANMQRLLKLAPAVQDALAAGKLSAGHARALLMIHDPVAQESLAEEIVAHGLSVRSVETRARVVQGNRGDTPAQNAGGKTVPAPAPSPLVAALEDRFRRKLGTKVKLAMTEHGAGELRISFFSPEELEKLLELLEV